MRKNLKIRYIVKGYHRKMLIMLLGILFISPRSWLHSKRWSKKLLTTSICISKYIKKLVNVSQNSSFHSSKKSLNFWIKLVDKLYWYNMNMSILLRHSRIWESEVRYERYKSDEIVVGQNIGLWISNQSLQLN